MHLPRLACGPSVSATLTCTASASPRICAIDTDRYVWKNEGAIDLGLRLADVLRYGLESEPVTHTGKRNEALSNPVAIRAKIAPRLEKAGATPEEIGFLLHRRVELNAFTSGQLIEWIEATLVEHGVAKVIPSAEAIGASAEATIRSLIIRREMDRITARIEARFLPRITAKAEAIANNRTAGKGAELREAVERVLKREPELPWTSALRDVLAFSP